MHVVHLNALFQRLLGVGLDGSVQGQGQIVAVDGVDVIGVAVIHLHVLGSLARHHTAGHTLEQVLVPGLQAVGAALGVHKTQHLAGQGTVGEIEVVGGIVLLNKGPDGLGVLLLDLGGQHLILGVGLLHALFQLFPVQVRHQLTQAVHHHIPLALDLGVVGILVQVAVLILELTLAHTGHQVLGGQDQVVYRGRHGQHIAVGIQDLAPVGRHGHVHQLLLDGFGLILIVVHDGDVPQLDQQRNK